MSDRVTYAGWRYGHITVDIGIERISGRKRVYRAVSYASERRFFRAVHAQMQNMYGEFQLASIENGWIVYDLSPIPF